MNKRLSDCQIVTRVNRLRKLASETYTHNLEILETLRDKQKEYLSNSSPYCLKDLIKLSELKCERDEKWVKGCDYALEVVSFFQDCTQELGECMAEVYDSPKMRAVWEFLAKHDDNPQK